jgi:fermentation-respiration switch protein FrsA (DUF1100 family)
MGLSTRLLETLLFFPSRAAGSTPAALGLRYLDLEIPTEDGERLHGFWIPAPRRTRGHLLLCHGNAGNIGDRILHARRLVDQGLDVLLFDYRGYGRSTGRPSVAGTRVDARAARSVLLSRPEVDPGRVVYLGESVGGAVALELAEEAAPRGLVLLSSFSSIREMRRVHYPFVPEAFVPDAYPSLALIGRLEVPVLVVHGERDEIVPVEQARALFAAARGTKRLEILPGVGHNDLVPLAGERLAALVAAWLEGLS